MLANGNSFIVHPYRVPRAAGKIGRNDLRWAVTIQKSAPEIYKLLKEFVRRLNHAAFPFDPEMAEVGAEIGIEFCTGPVFFGNEMFHGIREVLGVTKSRAICI